MWTIQEEGQQQNEASLPSGGVSERFRHQSADPSMQFEMGYLIWGAVIRNVFLITATHYL